VTTRRHELVRVEPDGTRVYSNYYRYKPKAPDEWKRGAPRKPDDPDAFRIRGDWFLPLDLLPDEDRKMPDPLRHMQRVCVVRPGLCGCPQTCGRARSGR
jgi:hypothetical protein